MAMSRLDLLPAELRIDIFKLSMKAAFEEDMTSINNQLEKFDRTSLDSSEHDEQLQGIVNAYYNKPSACLTTSTAILSMYPAFHMIVYRFWRSTWQKIERRRRELHDATTNELNAALGGDPERLSGGKTRLDEYIIEYYPLLRVQAFFRWEWEVLRQILSTAEQIDTKRPSNGRLRAACSSKTKQSRRHEEMHAKALTETPPHYLSQVHAKRWTQLCYSNYRFLHSYECKEYRKQWILAQRRLEEHKATCEKCRKQRKYRHYSRPRPWLKYRLARRIKGL